ncbi:MAG: sigma-70 family RNA polymerase sigma factor [Planctomycetota bacterium]
MVALMNDRDVDLSLEESHADAGPAGEPWLVERARQGDQQAFGELVLRYERRLMRVISRFVNDAETVRDLAQETFLKAFRRLDQFDPSRRFGPWLFRIGVNRTLDHLRKKKRRGRWPLFSDVGVERQPDPGVEDPRQAIDLSQDVRKVLEKIPENYRSVLILRDLEGFSTSEIAAIMERKEATIRWRLAEARNRFAKLWSARLSEGAAGQSPDAGPAAEEAS